MSVRVNAAEMADVEAITALWVDLVTDQQQFGTHLAGRENRAAARSVVEQYVHADGVAVARRTDSDGGVLGFVMFHVEHGMYQQDARRGIVENVYVVPAARGDGIGSRLLEYAEDALAADGADVIALSVLADNERAQALYRNRGYRPHRIPMEKRVGADTSSNDPA